MFPRPAPAPRRFAPRRRSWAKSARREDNRARREESPCQGSSQQPSLIPLASPSGFYHFNGKLNIPRPQLMIANRILNIILDIIGIVVIPCQFVIKSVVVIAVTLTFGLLLFPINLVLLSLSLVWIVLLAPMLALSWTCEKVPALQNIIGILFIPWVVVAETFVALVPVTSGFESRVVKSMLCQTWPFTWECWLFTRHQLFGMFGEPRLVSITLRKILNRISDGLPPMERVIHKIYNEVQLDTNE